MSSKKQPTSLKIGQIQVFLFKSTETEKFEIRMRGLSNTQMTFARGLDEHSAKTLAQTMVRELRNGDGKPYVIAHVMSQINRSGV